MKAKLFFYSVFICQIFISSFIYSQAPANDNCAGAINIPIGTPPACGTGTQTGTNGTVVGNITNATPGNPYIYQTGCSGASATQSFPANDVWYRFTATGYNANINITSTFANPNVAFYSGNCAALGGGIGGCAVGTGGNVALTVTQLVPGTTYYLQVSGNTGQTGTFTMTLNNSIGCSACLVNSSLTINPPPVNGSYPPGTLVQICFKVNQYNTINTNWFHGVQLSLGPCWDLSTLTTNTPTPAGGSGTWSYYPGGIGVQNAVNWGPGWYFDFNPPDGNPRNNFGDLPSGVVTGAMWNFCATVRSSTVCNPGCDLSVTFNTSGDGESGSWSNNGCTNDQPAKFQAIGGCCPPIMAMIPVRCFGTNTGTASATPVGAAGPYTYVWNGPAAYTSSASAVPGAHTITNLASGIYTVTITDNNLCSASNTILVTQPTSVTAVTTVTNASCASPGDASVLAGGGTPGYTYTWIPSGGTGATATGLVPGIYTVTVADSRSCTTTATANVQQTGTISAAFSTPSPTQCITGNSFVFTASDLSGTHTYSFNPTVGAPPTGNTATYGPVNFTSPGTYTIIHTITNGVCSNTATSIVLINAIPIVTASNNGPACDGGSLILNSTGGGTYSWSGPAGFTSAVQNPTINPITLVNAGIYTVTVSLNGCTNTETTSVSVSIPTTAASNTGSYCAGSTIQLNANAATSYTWTGPLGFTSNMQNPTIPSSTSAMSGNYTVYVSIGTCTAMASTSVTVGDLPLPLATNTGPYCEGTTIQLNVGVFPNYSWTGPNGFNSILQNPTIAPATTLESGNYVVSVTDVNGCSNTSTTTVVVNASPLVSAAGSTVCENFNATLTSSGGITYNWTGPNGFVSGVQNPIIVGATSAAAGQYTVIITDVNSCTNTAVANVGINPAPTPLIITNSPICINSVLSLSGVGGVTYNWTGPNGFVSAVQNPTIQATSTVWSGNYQVLVTDANGCSATTNTNVVVNPLPVPSITSGPNTGCAPLCVQFSVTSNPAAATAFWTFGNGVNANGVTNASTCYKTTGIYTISVVVTDLNGCTGSAVYTAEVYPKPIADFNHAPIKPIINIDGDVVFTDASYGANIVAWNWYFMNTAQFTSNIQNPTFVYTEAGTYAVALVVTSDKGCKDTLVRPLVVGEDFGIYVPNAFTPNGDGLNEVFQPKGFGIVKYNLKIFDRWGEKIFETSSFEEGWDGKYQGRGDKIIQNGVYTWLIEVTSVFGKAHELKGHVTLIK